MSRSKPLLSPSSSSPTSVVQDAMQSLVFPDPQSPTRQLDSGASYYHKLLSRKIANKFGTLRNCFRLVDEDASGTCDRQELKTMLMGDLFNLHIPSDVSTVVKVVTLSPDPSFSAYLSQRVVTASILVRQVMDRIIDLADYDRSGDIKFDEFARLFSSDDIHRMKRTLSAVDVSKYGEAEKVDERIPLDPITPMKAIRRHHSHFPAASLTPVNDAVDLAHRGASFLPRVLTSSHGRAANFGGHHSPPRQRFLGMAPAPHYMRHRADSTALPPAGKAATRQQPLKLDWPLHEAYVDSSPQ